MLNAQEKKTLHQRLTDPKEAFARLGDTIITKHGPLTHIDRGGNILAVAHLDTVKWNPKPKIKRTFKNTTIRKCPQLDDRLGAWICLDILPKAGCKCDVLLTDSEEIGQSTAQYFNEKNTVKYNWIIEFDRPGSDVVMYDYETEEYRDLLEDYGYKVGWGSFTDICNLEDLGCKAFNFGVGYHAQHHDECYANIAETWDSFRKFHEMYKDWHEYHFEHTKKPKQTHQWNYGQKGHWYGNKYTTNAATYSGRPKTKNSGKLGYYNSDNTLKETIKKTDLDGYNNHSQENYQYYDQKTDRDVHEINTIANDLYGLNYDSLNKNQKQQVEMDFHDIEYGLDD